ncbi:MAG: class I SAM-dependent methyltransferase [Planctomycetota bacterium]
MAAGNGGYHGRERGDLLALVPSLPAGSRVLELGCGEGRLGAQLRQRGLEVHGVEVVEAAAARARAVLDRVWVGDVERMALDYPSAHFRLLVCGDVLEHLVDPWAQLRRLRPLLTDDAVVVASVPNLQYFPVALGLLCGRFDYADSGVLDRTHLRFFTRRSARALFEGHGYDVVAMPRRYPFRSGVLRAVAAALDLGTLGLLRGLLTGQVIVLARPRAGGRDGVRDGTGPSPR